MWLADSKYSVTSLPNFSMPSITQGPVLHHWSLFSPLLWKMFHLVVLNHNVLILAFVLSCCSWRYKTFLGNAAHYSWALYWKALILQCHSPVAAGQSRGRDTCFSFKGPSSGHSCTSVKAQSPEQCTNTSGSFCSSCCSQALEEIHESNLCVLYPKVQSSGPWSGHAVLPAAAWAGGAKTLQGCLCLSGWQRSHCHLIGILFSPEAWLLPHLLDACNAQHVPLQHHTACDLSCWLADMDRVPLRVLSAMLSSGLFFKTWLSV